MTPTLEQKERNLFLTYFNVALIVLGGGEPIFNKGNVRSLPLQVIRDNKGSYVAFYVVCYLIVP